MSKRPAESLQSDTAALKSGGRPQNGDTQEQEFEDEFEDEFESDSDAVFEAGEDGQPDEEEGQGKHQRGCH